MMEKKSEETSAEMLKNTPSNIRRLADEIEQCEGRQKYLAQTSSASDGGDVRWYFCKVPLPENELAASVPRAEIVGKSEYFRFGMRDSLAIESAFLQKEEELLSSWWKEYADCSEGPRAPKASSSKLDAQLRSSVLESAGSPQLFTPEEERVGVPVKGGLYEVDLVKRHCFPVYWNGEDRRVLRGQWFALNKGLDWLPLREDVAEQLEYAYRGRVWRRRTFQQSGLFAARVDLQGSTLGLHALFTGEDETWEAWLNSDASGFSSAFNFGGNGVRLRRGYASSQSSKPTQDELRQQREEEMDDYCSEVPVRHVVFMVHGIGQRLEKSNLVDDVATFRQITANLAERHLTRYQRGIQRVLFIPCQWRRNLKLSGESAVEKITLDGLRGLRVMLSATAHDILYYMSPIYCQAIIDSVSNQLNRKAPEIGNVKGIKDGGKVVESEMKVAERKTLGDNVSKSTVSERGVVGSGRDGKRVDSVVSDSGSKSVDGNVWSEFSGQVYADGKRWGYYPGLDGHLSFSNFMDAFFRKGRCSTRIFMVWNSPPWAFSVRHQRGLESLLVHNPDACVVIFSETIELNLFDGFVKDGFKVAVAMPNLDELLKDTPTHIFASVWLDWKKTKFYSTHLSELVRLASLYKYGGIYLDSDIIVLRALSSLNNTVGLENEHSESDINGAVMAFDKHSPFIWDCLTEFYSTYDDTLLRWNGAELLTRVGKSFLNKKSPLNKKMELKLQPSSAFFPISRDNITSFFTTPSTTSERSLQDGLFKKILNESVTFHFWNSLTSALIPEPDSLVAKLINHSCIRCSDVL